MKIILPSSVPIIALLQFATDQGLEVRLGGEDLVFQPKRKTTSNVRSFERISGPDAPRTIHQLTQ